MYIRFALFLKYFDLKTTIKNDFLEIEILHRGAELCTIKSQDKQYLWNGNPLFWGKHSPILFPIVGTLKNNKYHIDAIEFEMSRHGFARDFDFVLIEHQDFKVVFELKSNVVTLKIYPFQFVLHVIYEIIDSEIKVSFEVHNKNNFKMPFSIGGHPAFALTSYIENYELEFEIQETLTCFLLENDLLTANTYKIELQNKRLKLNYELFENDALIFKDLRSKKVTVIEKNRKLLQISFSDFKNLGIWTKKKAPFICIEPWLGYADLTTSKGDFLKKEGIQTINANTVYHCSYVISIF